MIAMSYNYSARFGIIRNDAVFAGGSLYPINAAGCYMDSIMFLNRKKTHHHLTICFDGTVFFVCPLINSNIIICSTVVKCKYQTNQSFLFKDQS